MSVYRHHHNKVVSFALRHAFLLRLLATTVLAGLIPFMLLSAINTYSKAQEDQLRLHQQTGLVSKSISSQLETCMDMILRLNSHLSTGSILANPAQLSRVSTEREFLNLINMLKSSLPFVDDFGYYIPTSGSHFYTTGGKYQLDIYARQRLRTDEDEFVSSISSVDRLFFIPWSEYGQTSAVVIPLRVYATSTNVATGVYVFSNNSIADFFATSLPRGYVISELYAPNGVLIYRFPQSVIKSGAYGGGSTYSDNTTDTTYLVSETSTAKGYSCIIYVPEDTLLLSASYYSRLARTFIVLAVVVTLILVGLVVAVNYIPVMRLVNRVEGTPNLLDQEDQDELAMLHDVFIQQEDNVRQMQATIEAQRLAMMDYVFGRILEGKTVSAQDINMIQEKGMKYILAIALLSEVQDINAILAQNTPDGDVFAVELYKFGILALIIHYETDFTIVQRTIEEMLNSTHFILSDETYNLENLHGLFTDAVHKLSDNQNGNIPNEQFHSSDDTIQKIVSYVDLHYIDSTFSVTSTAEYLGISEYSTGKLLRNIYGANFRRVINEKRVSYSKELLMTSTQSIGEIGKSSGFTSTSYFIKVFKDLEGITPTQFREFIKMH